MLLGLPSTTHQSENKSFVSELIVVTRGEHQ